MVKVPKNFCKKKKKAAWCQLGSLALACCQGSEHQRGPAEPLWHMAPVAASALCAEEGWQVLLKHSTCTRSNHVLPWTWPHRTCIMMDCGANVNERLFRLVGVRQFGSPHTTCSVTSGICTWLSIAPTGSVRLPWMFTSPDHLGCKAHGETLVLWVISIGLLQTQIVNLDGPCL